jgi:hypothetical protein
LKSENSVPEIRNHIISTTLNTRIAKKHTNKGINAMLNELLRELFHFFDAERISFKERRAISPTTTAAPYCGRPGLVIIEIALEDIALDEIILNNIVCPHLKNLFFFLLYKYKV